MSYTLEVIQDPDPVNPHTNFDPLGTMVCWHRRYDLGDEQPGQSPEEFFFGLARAVVSDTYPDSLLEANCRKILQKHYVKLPLYLYAHSGLAISTSPFSCPWDSGRVGDIFLSLEKAKKELLPPGHPCKKGWDTKLKVGETEITLREAALRNLQCEVEEYNQYLTGDVWGYVIKDEDGEVVDSCWGFYGRDHCELEGNLSLQQMKKNSPQQLDMFEVA